MLPALSQVCTLNSPFAQDLEDYAAGACRAVEIWLGKLETFLQDHTTDDVRRLLDQHGLVAPVASYQGGLLTSQGEQRKQHWDHFAQRLTLCQTLEIGTLVIAGDIGGPLDQNTFERIRVSLKQAAQQASEKNVRLAFEFRANAPFANNLSTAAALIDDLGEPSLGICLDAFHFSIGPSKTEDLGCLTPANLFHVQLSDVAGVPREWAKDSDRIMPGDGDFPLVQIIEHLRAINYQGCVSLELMNPQIWQISSRQFGEIAITGLRKILGQASMA